MKRSVYSSAGKETPKKKKDFFQRVKPLAAGITAITISVCSYIYLNRNFPFWEAGIYSYSERSGMVSHWEKDGTVETAWAIASLSDYLNMNNKALISEAEKTEFIVYPIEGELQASYDSKNGKIHLYLPPNEYSPFHEILHLAFDKLLEKEEKKGLKNKLRKLHRLSSLPEDEQRKILGGGFNQETKRFLDGLFDRTNTISHLKYLKSKEEYEEHLYSEIFASLPTYNRLGILPELEEYYLVFVNEKTVRQHMLELDLNIDKLDI